MYVCGGAASAPGHVVLQLKNFSCAVQPQFLKRRCVAALTGTSCVPSQGSTAAAALGVHQGPSMCCQGYSSQLLMGSSCCQHCQAPPKHNS